MSDYNRTNYDKDKDLAHRLIIEFESEERQCKHIQEALIKNFQEHGLILDNIETQVWTLFDEYTYGSVNKAHADFLGVEKKDLENKHLFEMVSKEEALVCIVGNKDVFEKKEKIQTEEWVENGKGEKRLLSITKIPKLNNQGDIMYVICMANDITKKKTN